jgi:hypothetical protein
MPFDIDFDQVDPAEPALGKERVKAAEPYAQRFLSGAGGADPRSTGVGVCRGYDRDGKFRSAVVAAERAADDFSLA